MTLSSCVRPHIITREQLGKVLTLVSVSGQEEGEAQLLLRRLQAVEEEVRGGEEKKEERVAREEEGKRREEENRKLKAQLGTGRSKIKFSIHVEEKEGVKGPSLKM